MVTVTAFWYFDNGFDRPYPPTLTSMIRSEGRWEYYDNQPINVGGLSYPDTYRVIWPEETSLSDLLGKKIQVDLQTGAITGGTITGIVDAYFNDGEWWIGWAIQKLSLPAESFYRTALSRTLDDDERLLERTYSGADRFDLSDKTDFAYGYGGKDRIEGNGGDDHLFGQNGSDKLLGGDGKDQLDGGAGLDRLTGGAGGDRFEFWDIESAGDSILDFDGRDTILIHTRNIETEGWSLDLNYGFQVSADNKAQQNYTFLIFRTTDSTLWFDSDGARDEAPVLIADLQAGAMLTAEDIELAW